MEWDPTQFFRDDEPPAPFALLILNQPINEKAYSVLSKHACITVCADGGANHFYEMMKSHGQESSHLPNIIIGDLDSLRPSIKAHYENLGVNFIYDGDKYSTDFMKCLKYLRGHTEEATTSPSSNATKKPTSAQVSSNGNHARSSVHLDILVLGGLGGRVDQAFSQIHHLYFMLQEQHSNPNKSLGNIYLISEESITFILLPGRSTIRTPFTHQQLQSQEDQQQQQQQQQQQPQQNQNQNDEDKYILSENVGIIPLSGPTHITIRGFEWDVDNWKTEIGGQLSTSNHIRADVVSVEAGIPVLFTVELAERFKRAR